MIAPVAVLHVAVVAHFAGVKLMIPAETVALEARVIFLDGEIVTPRRWRLRETNGFGPERAFDPAAFGGSR